MKTMKRVGLLLVAVGLCVLGYQGIESIMTEGTSYYDYTLLDMLGENALAWHKNFPINSVARGIQYVINVPAYAVFLIVGAVLLVINGIFAKK
ncbi:MAG: hypothetical protein R6T92_02145 [Desulfosalsimonadaceae bacterium]